MSMKYEILRNLYYKDKTSYDREYERRINSDCSFHLNISINGNDAFFLALPDLYEQVYWIVKKDCEIDRLCATLPGAAIRYYLRKSLIGEIVGTNDIEQVHSSRKEINEYLGAGGKKSKRSRFKDIINRYSLIGAEHYELSTCEDIRKIYDDLLYEEIKEENQSDLPDGEYFRRSSVDVRTSTDRIIHTGVTPEREIIRCMETALHFLNNDQFNVFIKLAVFHYLFGYIHPFYDGNGRISRFISSILLYENLSTKLIAYRLSGTIKNNLSQYYKAFDLCNNPKNKGDITPFIYMFFDIIIKAMDNLERSLHNKKSQLDYYCEKLYLLPNASKEIIADIYFHLVQATLFSEVGINKNDMAQSMQISRSTLDSNFKKIPANLYTVVLVGKTKHYSFKLGEFDKLIEKEE